MRNYLILAIATFLAGLPATVWSQNAQQILEKSLAMDVQRKQGVSSYIIDQTMFGSNMLLYYEKVEGVGPDGVAYASFRLVPPDEIAARQGNGAVMSQEQLGLYAQGIEAIGSQIDSQTGDSSLTGNLATFVRAAETAQENRNDGSADALTEAQQMASFAAIAEFVGVETVDDKQAFHVRADNLNYSQPTNDGQEFTVNTVSLWIDTQQYVTLKLRMDGIALSDGELRDMYIEKVDTDYRAVGTLYEPYRQTMRMGGILDPAREAEMAESQAQLEDLETQMASMPPSQKAMMENMMGPQIEMLRGIVSGDGIQVETIVHEIRVNAGLPDTTEMGLKTLQMPGQMTSISGPGTATVTSNPPTMAPAALQEAQQLCLQAKVEAAQAKQKKKRGFGRLISAVSRTAAQFGNYDIARTAGQVYGANATAKDLSAAAKDLGLTKDDVQSCQNPT